MSTELNRFRLYTGCAPVALVVEKLHQDATEIGLSHDDIQRAVRSRLRGARIYSSGSDHVPYLYINVSVVGNGFNIYINLNKLVSDIETESVFATDTWHTSSTGTHGEQGANHILHSLHRLLDIFIDEYLAVNESACE